jgi:hypothetical protein
MSPNSDIVGPSPVTSNGTATTEIEDEAAENAEEENGQVRHSHMMLRTNIPDHIRRPLSEEVVSVIHAPPSFQNWKSNDAASRSNSASVASVESTSASSPPPSEPSTVTPPTQLLPTVNTKVKPVAFGIDAPTPQAQKLEDVLASDPSKLRSSTASSLERETRRVCTPPKYLFSQLVAVIPESHEVDADDDEYDDADDFADPGLSQDSEVKALRAALEECWTLCNTLANLSTIHRERVFNSSGTPDAHEKAWKSCWKLCKRLYHSRDDISESYGVRTNLDLCRDFCQSLFDVRQKKDETADSILRVSFELNNQY